MFRILYPFCTIVLLSALATAQDIASIEIETIKVGDNVYMLVGRGGNIGLSIGDDGAFLVDDEYAPLTDKILAAVKKLTDKPVRFVVNTHWHTDHTGGNENLAKAGAFIIAHDNVRQRLSKDQLMKPFNRVVPAAPADALPVITFNDKLTLHWNGDEIDVTYVGPAHTDGDAILFFRNANVLHAGDVYFNGIYPFIDVAAGGSLDGMISATDKILALVNDQTKIIPGHGPLSGVAELRAYREMLKTARDRIGELVKAGKLRDEVIAAKPTAELDASWGKGFMKPDVWVGIVYDGMQSKPQRPDE